MNAIRLHVRGLLNSFRDPNTHKIHRTFPFPPRTTLIGLAGAALGISEDTIWQDCKDFKVAVVDISKKSDIGGMGKAEDLIKYKKYKDNKIETSIFVRELLYKPEYLVYYTSNDENHIDALYHAFLNPKYVLSLGRDDEIISIKSVEKIDLRAVDSGEFGETILPFNPKDEGFEIDIVNQKYFEPYSLATLPSTFIVKDNVRQPSDFKIYAFLNNLKIHLSKQGGFTDGRYNFFLL
ncbi:CRISPR-associated protein Cas5 [uncultured Methanolobus sp.]|uniref:CRISPR-associated protein Cas5 n=1 Tax=uncultured Methanolobus sp. TaxID=218300 RepID=UPI002AAB19C1|nr:CRISPR-associated protein Cas5 [uncultured Methanolobus sp.]